MKTTHFYTIILLFFVQQLAAQHNGEFNNQLSNSLNVNQVISNAKIALSAHDYDSCIVYALTAQTYGKKNNDLKILQEADLLLADAYTENGNFSQAETYYLSALTYSKAQRDTLISAQLYNTIGRLYKKTTQYSKALQAFNNAFELYSSLQDDNGMALVNLNVGNILKSIGQTEKAKQEYKKALVIFETLGDNYNAGGCYNNLGNIFKNDAQYDSAFYFMYKTLQIREQDSSLRVRAYIYHNLANLHVAVNNLDSAMFYINKSIEINLGLHSDEDIASDYNVLGSIYMAKKDWTKAIFNFEIALTYLNNDVLSENKIDIVKQLGIVYYQTENYKKSADYLNTYINLSDSMLRSNQNALIELELIQYELFTDSLRINQLLLEKDLEQSKKENAELANRNSTRNFYYIIIILFLFIAIVIILFIGARKRLRQTRTHEAILQVQNDELKRTLISKEEKEILLKEVHHRVKNNLQIINSLIRLQSNFMNAKNFKEKLMETENRIRSMALIHEKLYKTGNLASLGVKNYIEELSFNIIESYENHNVKIKLTFDLEEKEYGIDALIPIGLIINEVLSNALKHAFYERNTGTVSMSLHSDEKKSVMIIKDDGLGADLTLDELKEDSLGLELIISLTDQLDGELSLNTENGFEYQFIFPRLY